MLRFVSILRVSFVVATLSHRRKIMVCVAGKRVVVFGFYLVECSMNDMDKRYSLSLYSRLHWLPLFTIVLVLSGCNLNGPGVRIPTGNYAGEMILTRNAPGDTTAQGYRLQAAELVLRINADSQTYRFTPRGDSTIILSSNGSYALTFGKITFTDRSNRTFSDPSLVMSGECTYTFDGSNLVINQTDTRTKREKSMILVLQ